MLQRHAAFFSLLCSIVDILTISIAWIAVYWIRFYWGIFSTAKGISAFERHLLLTAPVVVACYLSCVWAGLYKPKRIQTLFVQLADIFKAGLLGGLLVLALFYYVEDQHYSRTLLMLFCIMLFCGLACAHLFTMAILRSARRRGYNLRYYAVVGAGKKAQQLVRDIEHMGWLGLKCRFFVDDDPTYVGTMVSGVPMYGPIEKLAELVKTNPVDEVYLALDGNDAQKAYPTLKSLQCLGTTIRIIPDWGHLISTHTMTAEAIGSQVLFSASESPLNGANIVVKEIFDRVVALILLTMMMVPFALIATMIKVSSKGPVFHKQPRVGMDQKEFEIVKFRTMRVGAEKESSWTRENDPRVTPIGRWLRKTSLDELPQLLNVLNGEMSLV
ncbi:MAG: sugar transferase, partial [Sedimentisphaerales bacterium]|nr:sugar transferase [Sedimentisphaerales bacterium]